MKKEDFPAVVVAVAAVDETDKGEKYIYHLHTYTHTYIHT
jgi:hypothetical protein